MPTTRSKSKLPQNVSMNTSGPHVIDAATSPAGFHEEHLHATNEAPQPPVKSPSPKSPGELSLPPADNSCRDRNQEKHKGPKIETAKASKKKMDYVCEHCHKDFGKSSNLLDHDCTGTLFCHIVGCDRGPVSEQEPFASKRWFRIHQNKCQKRYDLVKEDIERIWRESGYFLPSQVNVESKEASSQTPPSCDYEKEVRMIFSLKKEDVGDELIDAANNLFTAFCPLLTVVKREDNEEGQNLVGFDDSEDTSMGQMNSTGKGDIYEAQHVLLGLAKNVANCSTALAVIAQNLARTIKDTQESDSFISVAAGTALSAFELVACARFVAPGISNERCQHELAGARRRVAIHVKRLLNAANNLQSPSNKCKILVADLREAAMEVSRTLDGLLHHIRPQPKLTIAQKNVSQEAYVTSIAAAEKIMPSVDTTDMTCQAQTLAQTTNQLLQVIKGEAEHTQDPDLRWKLIMEARALTDATCRVVEAVKQCASNQGATTTQNQLRQAFQDVREATNFASGVTTERKGLLRLESAAKNAASAEVVAALRSASPHFTNAITHDAMSMDCSAAVVGVTPQHVRTVKTSLQAYAGVATEGNGKPIRLPTSFPFTMKKAVSFVDGRTESMHKASALTDPSHGPVITKDDNSGAAIATCSQGTVPQPEVLGSFSRASACTLREESGEILSSLTKPEEDENLMDSFADGANCPLRGYASDDEQYYTCQSADSSLQFLEDAEASRAPNLAKLSELNEPLKSRHENAAAVVLPLNDDDGFQSFSFDDSTLLPARFHWGSV